MDGVPLNVLTERVFFDAHRPRGSHDAPADASEMHAPDMRVTERLDGFGVIKSRHIGGVIWRRSLPAHVTQALKTAAFSEGLDRRGILSLQDVREKSIDFLGELGVGDEAVRDWLGEDIAALAAMTARILVCMRVALRVEIVCDDACRKFHQDTVPARLICTYRGPGTEYGLAERGGEPEKSDAVPTGCPVFLKGKAWSSEHGRVLLHRSPRISDTGEARLMVVIDGAG